jgi:hypothetical protein
MDNGRRTEISQEKLRKIENRIRIALPSEGVLIDLK